MVIIEMREANSVVIVALCCTKVLLQLRRQIDAAVPGISGISHVCVVDKKLLAVGEIDAGTIRVAEGMKSQFGRHIDGLQ